MNLDLITYKNLNENSTRIAHFSSTRMGGVSKAAFDSLNLGLFTEDDSLSIHENRLRLCSVLGISMHQLHNAHQTHGVNVKLIDEQHLQLDSYQRQQALDGYDALITNIPAQCITVTTADCVPILLYDKTNKAVAAIHSGWRSTVENICAETLTAMQKAFGTKPQDVVAAIGPCISKEVYEVGEDVYSAIQSKGYLPELFFDVIPNGKYLFDIRALVAHQLQVLGVKSIEVSTHCTFQQEELFFSARRLGNNSGRMLSGIFLKD